LIKPLLGIALLTDCLSDRLLNESVICLIAASRREIGYQEEDCIELLVAG
jgi:hypothetical protein